MLPAARLCVRLSTSPLTNRHFESKPEGVRPTEASTLGSLCSLTIKGVFGRTSMPLGASTMSLVHISRIQVSNGYLGRTIYRLIDSEGDFISGFDRYSHFLINKRNYPFSTLKRYSEAASRFIDYLYEVRVLGEPTTNLEINRAVESYPHLLRAGARFKDGDIQRTKQLRAYATAIGMKEGLSPNSFPPTLAAINLLLLVAQDLAHEAAATVGPLNVTESTNAEVLISAINGFTSLSYRETKRLKQNSLLGSVMHLRGPVRRPNSLRRQ
jgi:hypothetical protein